MKRALLTTLVLCSAAAAALAQQPAAAGHDKPAAAAAEPVAAADMSEGEVRKVDKASGKITLRHGPIRNLDMPPMTMVFRVSDPTLLEALKPGDKVRFVARKEGVLYYVDRIEPVR